MNIYIMKNQGMAVAVLIVLMQFNAFGIDNSQLQATASITYLKQQQDLFLQTVCIYDDDNSGNAHFYPTGWIGDIADDHTNIQEPVFTPNDTVNLDASGTNPDNRSCIRIRVSGSGGNTNNGYYGMLWQFPENNWGGLAGVDLTQYVADADDLAVIFSARGAKGNEFVRFHSGGTNWSPRNGIHLPYKDSYYKRCLPGSMREGLVQLDTAWKQYKFDLSGSNLHHVISPFSWNADADMNPGGLEFYLDNIEIQLSERSASRRLAAPHFIRSYLYDNALALIAFIANSTSDGLLRAGRIADAMVYAQDHDRTFSDGRLRNAYSCGELWNDREGGSIRLPGFWDDKSAKWAEDRYNVGTDCGNMAWAIISLLSYGERIGVGFRLPYIKAAERLGDWIFDNAYSLSGGYTGGVEGWEKTSINPSGQDKILWKSTEHNIDIYVAFTRLSIVTGKRVWQERAEHAKSFVQQMWSADFHHFWTGTISGSDSINRSFIPLDVHPWAILALQDTSYCIGVLWAADSCYTRRGNMQGFDFKADMHQELYPPGIWWEGTAQMAAAFEWMGSRDKADEMLQEITVHGVDVKHAGAVYACDPDTLATGVKKQFTKDKESDWCYFKQLHIGATCWYYFATISWNPYWSEPIIPKIP
jgi:hypothetical protein